MGDKYSCRMKNHGTMIRMGWIFVGPAILSPLLFLGTEFRCAFCIILLSSFWIVEVVPIGIISLLPIFLFPIMGIQSAKDISQVYFKDSIVLFACTLVMAMAVEETNLHRRIALGLLKKVGARKQTMLLGFLTTTSFMSFFVSDTACTALMTPIAIAILVTMQEASTTSTSGVVEKWKNDQEETKDKNCTEMLNLATLSRLNKGFCKALVLSCAHGSLIGGTAIITSTGPNLVFRENLHTFYPNDEVTMTYLQWITFAMPPLFLYLLASHIVLTCAFLGPLHLFSWFRKQSREERNLSLVVEKNVSRAYDELGPITFAEKSVLFWFCFLIASWILRKPGFIPGWGHIFPNDGKLLTDSVPGILVVFILFAWPKDPFSDGPWAPILTWDAMRRRFSWSCMLLIGAGYAISDGVQSSGLSALISCTMKGIFSNLHSTYLQLAVTASITLMTEFASNVSTGSIFIPIVISIAESLGVHPLYLALPATVACSFAFMLPMATPPNAVVYDTKIVSMIEMVSTGFFLNLLCILITTLNMNTWTYWLFNLSSFPNLPSRHNFTAACG